MASGVRITLYLDESDRAKHDRAKHGSLHNEILQFLHHENIAGAYAFHAIAGFIGRNQIHTAGLVEASGKLPVIVTFVDTLEHIERVLPTLLDMAPHRLIVRENVNIVQNPFD
jgi:uncharacterized protein